MPVPRGTRYTSHMNQPILLPFCIVAVFSLLLSNFLLADPAASPRLDPAKLSALGPAMQSFIDQHQIAGAVTLVADRQGVLDIETFGQADIEKKIAMKPDTMFWIASMTKPMTASAILMLQDQGKLSVDDLVSKYLPDFASVTTRDGKPANLTLRHLLTHTSGMEEATHEEAIASRTLAELIPNYVTKPVDFVPGSKWSYCQSAINTLGRVVEVVSGDSFPDFLQKNFFGPLNMKDTTFYPTADQASRIATSYKRTEQGALEPAAIWLLNGMDVTSRDRYPAPNAGLFATAGDYARFARMILNRGTLDGHRYLSPEAVAQMTSVQTGDLQTGFTPGNGWGLGWCVIRHPQGLTAALSPGTFGHGGAFGTQVWIDPVKGVIYLLMVQRANFPNSDASDVRKSFQEIAAGALR
jgi:CubicO group peptidase (beta-lactamase class C family)